MLLTRWPLPGFVVAQPKLAAFALMAMFSSSFGQTFFIAVFGGELRAAFDLSHTLYGSLYAGATVIAALLLLPLGPWVDRWPLRRMTMAATILLAIGCVVMGSAFHAGVLGLGFVLIRLGGQGLLGHLGLTAAGRYFQAHRGRAVALAAMGIPLGEACLPAAAAWIMTVSDWHTAWLAAAAFALLILLPLLGWLATAAPMPHEVTSSHHDDDDQSRDFSRSDALRDPGFYCLLPIVLMVPFAVTGLLFHLSAIAEASGWSLTLAASALSGFAAGHVFALFTAGPLVDRFGAQCFLPLSMMPMIAGLLLLAAFEGSWVAWGQLTLTGISLGFVAIPGGPLWPARHTSSRRDPIAGADRHDPRHGGGTTATRVIAGSGLQHQLAGHNIEHRDRIDGIAGSDRAGAGERTRVRLTQDGYSLFANSE